MSPVLRTDRLLLVPLADRHLELEVRLDADPEVLRYITGRARSRDEVVASHAERMALAARVDGLGYWMAFESEREDDAAFAGLMMLPPAHGPDQPDDPAVAELGYRLPRRCWRRGLATEASRALLAHAFDTVGQHRVIAQTMAVNAGSRGVMTAVGMRYVRTFHPSWDDPLPGAEQGEVEYEITREMWQGRIGRESPRPHGVVRQARPDGRNAPMSSSAQSDADRDDATVDSGSSTDQHVTGHPETGTFTVDEPPTGGTPAHGSSNKVFNEADGNNADRTDDVTGEWDASKG